MAIKFQTDQSGANNNVCSTDSPIFNFSLAKSNTLASADFAIKKGSGTTTTIVATVYDQPNGAGNIVESVSVLAANVTQTFASVIFTFAGTTTLNAGTSYSLKVSSTTSCVGSSPYSIKLGNFQVIDTNSGGVINTGYGIGADLLNVSTAISVANASLLTSSNSQNSTFFTSSANIDNNIAANIVNDISIDARATKINNNGDNRKIKLDGANIPVKIYLGNQRRRVYHGTRIIIDKN